MSWPVNLIAAGLGLFLALFIVVGTLLFPILTIIFGIIAGSKQLPLGQKRSWTKTIVFACLTTLVIIGDIIIFTLALKDEVNNF